MVGLWRFWVVPWCPASSLHPACVRIQHESPIGRMVRRSENPDRMRGGRSSVG